jgi:hypothetical protein
MPDNKTQIQMLRQEVESLKAELYKGNFSGLQDFNKYCRFNTRMKVPRVTALPATCEVGEVCSYTTKLYHCSAANTWTAQT